MSEEKSMVPQASQSVIDAAKKESHQWLNPEAWRTMGLVADVFLKSGAMPRSMDTAPKLIVALQAGKEAGLQPLEAVNSFYFVNGKISMYGEMAISQVMKAGHKVEWKNCNNKSATVKITRGDNGAESEVTFTMADAIERGLTKNPVYKTAPENMLRFKAFHLCARFAVPDAMHGVPVKEIMEAEYVEEEKPSKKITANGVSEATVQKAIEVAEEVSLEEAINKPEGITAEQIKTIREYIEKKGKEENKMLVYYKHDKLEDFTKEEADDAIKNLKSAPDKKIEEMPVEKKESKGAAAMRSGMNKTKTKEKVSDDDAGKWPEDVCKYLRFIEGINEIELSNDILDLKVDAMKGIFGGYEKYPSLVEEIKKIPQDFK